MTEPVAYNAAAERTALGYALVNPAWCNVLTGIVSTDDYFEGRHRYYHSAIVDLGHELTVPRLMEVERYSHVMHIVSRVEGQLKPDMDAFDLFMAAFPAGTVTGAPKIRAMEIISDLESSCRGPYAGGVGYFGFNGNMDFCITIRTMSMWGEKLSIQAGAGIVADSTPEGEYEETLKKAAAMFKVLERVTDNDSSHR